MTAAVESTVSSDDKKSCRRVTVLHDTIGQGKGQGARATSLRVLVGLSVGDVAELWGSLTV